MFHCTSSALINTRNEPLSRRGPDLKTSHSHARKDVLLFRALEFVQPYPRSLRPR